MRIDNELKRNCDRNQHRGLAMMLVLVSVGAATIMTTAYVASRDNSAAIGLNIASSSEARWSAVAGIDLAAAVLETDLNWRTGHTNGKLLDDYPFGGGMLDIDVLDMETNNPPTEESEHIQITTISTVNGVEQIAVAYVYATSTPQNAVDLDLSEFVVFGKDRVEIIDDALITRWPSAPTSVLGKSMKIGTNARNAGDISVSGNAASIDSIVYHGPLASNMLVSDSSGPALGDSELLDDIPVPASSSSGVTAPTDAEIDAHRPIFKFMSSELFAANSQVRSLSLMFGSTGTINDGVTLIIDNNFTMNGNSKLSVNGNARLVIFGDLIMDKSAIELQPGATLELFIGNQISLKNSYIGDLRVDSTVRDNSGYAGPMDVQRIIFYDMGQNLDGSERWKLSDNSIIKAVVYAPAIPFEVQIDSALYGAVVAKTIKVMNNGAIFYTHELDQSRGYTNPYSSVFTETGNIKNDILTISSISDAYMQWLADLLGLTVLKDDMIFTDSNAIVAGPKPPLPPMTPTPRPNPVEMTLLSFGADPVPFETQIGDAFQTDVVAAATAAAAAAANGGGVVDVDVDVDTGG